MWLRFVILPAFLFCALQAEAVCTGAVTVTNVSTLILAANDLPTPPGRSTLTVQNIGTQTMYCAIGTNNAATTSNGFMIMSGGELMFPSVSGPNGFGGEAVHAAPSGDLACVTPSGSTTAVFCDY